jgi:pimeloyl-ACP methyl ester carboxylesterase
MALATDMFIQRAGLRLNVDDSRGPGVTAAQLASLSSPTLVAGHHVDSVHPFAMAEEIAALIPKATLVQITPKARDPARYTSDFQSALHDFLKRFLK